MARRAIKKQINKWNRINSKITKAAHKKDVKSEMMFRKEQKKPSGLFVLLNPKNLQKEVHVYGYHFSEFTHGITILLVLFACAGLGILFELEMIYIMIITAVTLILLPGFILDMYRRMYEQKRFAQAGQYVEQILYSFKHTQKIYSALYDCLLVFEDGRMKDKITEAISYIDQGKSKTNKGVLREALEIIELEFPSDKIKNANQLLLSVEERGGEYEESAKLLIEDNNQWIRRGYGLQADKKKKHMEVVFSILTSIILCTAVLYSLDWMGNISSKHRELNIFKYNIIQITSTTFVIYLLLVYYKSSRALTNDWLKGFSFESEKILRSSYEYVVSYDEAKAQKKSILYALPVMFSIIPVYFFLSKWGCIPLFLLSCILLFQHKIGYYIAKQTVIKQLYYSFPQWLMDIALLLQNNNVFVSISKSKRKVNFMLQTELEQLIWRIQKEPNAMNSYTKFCKQFDIPEIYACMKMLYSIAESGIGNVNNQVHELLTQMSEMQKKSEEMQNEHTKYKMERIFFLPIAGVCLKMTFDMAFGMILMISSFQSVFLGG